MTAAAILVQGDTYLRPGEIFILRKDNVIQPRASRAVDVWGLILGLFEDGVPTRAGEFGDCVLCNTASRKDVNLIIKTRYQSALPGKPLFDNLTLQKYTEQIRLAAKVLGLQSLRFEEFRCIT